MRYNEGRIIGGILSWCVVCMMSWSGGMVYASMLSGSSVSSGTTLSGSTMTGYALPTVKVVSGYDLDQHALRSAILIKQRLTRYSPQLFDRLIRRIDAMIAGLSELSERRQRLQRLKFNLIAL